MKLRGNVWKFNHNVNTDEIIAARYLNTFDACELGAHCMEDIELDFSGKISVGDIIVAGRNFGCGSSREHAPIAIKGCGISCVIAESFARIFYRNAINIGLPILVSQQAAENINQGETLEIDLKEGKIYNLSSKKKYSTEKFADFMQEIIDSGGLLNWIQKKYVGTSHDLSDIKVKRKR
ncbi:MAG: 3-isopropylmalate dehydratase small subunit [Candidatus Omnitrophota bacterium]|nr:MAG: 3-isopropylmalate dehydratase small subunit [Candidatus Omnitrophota bacterium]